MSAGALVTYAFAVALVLTSSAWLLERALTSVRLPVRWVWMGCLGLSVWLPLAAFVAGPPERVTGDAPTSGLVVAPISGAGVVEETDGGGDEAAAGLYLLVDWRAGVGRVLASGASLLSPTAVAPAWIGGAWGAASMLAAMLLLGSTLRLNRRARRWPNETLLGRPVKVSPEMGPATIGWIAPWIVIPRWAKELPRHEMELILRHEGEHVHSRDTLLLSVGLLAIVACPWNPLVWWQMRRLKAAVEVDCDRRVLGHGVAPAPYGDLLVSLGSRRRLGSLAVPTIIGSTSLLERRLLVMKNFRGRTSLPSALAASAVALLLTFVACTTEAPVGTEPQAALEPSGAETAEAASEPSDRDLVAYVWVDQDGTVEVNGEAHPIEGISEAVAPLQTDGAVVSIEAHQAVPYRVVAAVQDELRAAGLLRVGFTAVESEALRPPPRNLSAIVEDGLTMVMPDSSMPNISQMNVSRRNLLFLEVLATGIVQARLGEDPRIREIAPREVEALWRQEVALNPSLIALMQTRPDAEYIHMYDVLAALQRAEATRFALELAE